MKKELVDEAIQLIIDCVDPSEKMQQKFIYSKNGLKSQLEKYVVDSNILSDEYAIIKIIAECMNYFIKDYPAPVPYKEGLRATFYNWFEIICDDSGVFEDDCHEMFNDIVDKYIDDTTIEVIKILHNQEGTTKEEISNILGVSEKTVQTILHKLEDTKEPFKLGGIPINLQIDTFDAYSEKCVYKKGDKYQKRRHYLTKNTMHPITYQMNLMQVGTLLYSLSKAYYEDEMYEAFYIALNTWCQLSEYARYRITEILAPKYDELSDFIYELSGMLDSDVRKFETEEFLLEEGDHSIDEKLNGMHKGSLVCGIDLTKPRRRLRNQRIFFDFDKHQYYAVSSENIDSATERLYLDKENIFDIYEE